MTRNKKMDVLSFLKENKIFDIFYRLLLWYLLGYGLYCIGNTLDSFGGDNLQKVIMSPPQLDFTQLIGVVGIFICGVALILKEFDLNRARESVPVYLASKISTDLILAPFNIMSFSLGWGAYLYFGGAFEGQKISILGILLVPYFTIMAFLALVSLTVRAQRGELIYSWFYSKSLTYRIIVAFIIIGVTVFVIFAR